MYKVKSEQAFVIADANHTKQVLKNVILKSLELAREGSIIGITCWIKFENAKMQLYFTVACCGKTLSTGEK